VQRYKKISRLPTTRHNFNISLIHFVSCIRRKQMLRWYGDTRCDTVALWHCCTVTLLHEAELTSRSSCLGKRPRSSDAVTQLHSCISSLWKVQKQMRSKQYPYEVNVLRKRVNHLSEGRQAFPGEPVNLFRTHSDTATQLHSVISKMRLQSNYSIFII